ncbi:MAG: exodeoxyribonuclease VII small subunit [Bacteroidota bacterium]
MKDQTYDSAFNELKDIMDQLSSDQISVDELTVKVKRAAELITFCNSLLRETESKVSEIVKKMGM